MHFKSGRISTAGTNFPELLLDGLTHASVKTLQTSICCRASGRFVVWCTDEPHAEQEFGC